MPSFLLRAEQSRENLRHTYCVTVSDSDVTMLLFLCYCRESSPEERIKAIHKKLMVGNHPDSGGSDLIAAKVNEAKDILLGKKKQDTIF